MVLAFQQQVLLQAEKSSLALQTALAIQRGATTWSDYLTMINETEVTLFPGIAGWTFGKLVSNVTLHEQEMRSNYFAEYSMYEPAENGSFVAVPLDRPYYVPVTYLVPFSNASRRTLGYNLIAPFPIGRNESIMLAMQTRKPTVGSRFILLEDVGNMTSFAVVMNTPIFSHRVVSPLERQVDDQFLGVIRAVMRISTLVEVALPISIRGRNFELRIFDLSEPNLDLQLLYSTNSRELNFTHVQIQAAIARYTIHLNTTLQVKNRQWMLVICTSNIFSGSTIVPQLVLGLILLFCIIVGVAVGLSYKLICLQYRYHVRMLAVLNQIMPPRIVKRIANGHTRIADLHHNTSVLFMDICDFTSFVARISPLELVTFLSEFVAKVDDLIALYQLEKIKMIGDSFFVSTNDDVEKDHVRNAIKLANFALASLESVCKIKMQDKFVQLRIGIHVGTVVSGVLGTLACHYDLWGVCYFLFF